MTEPSPLEEIELLVQGQARDLSVDTDQDPTALRALVEDAVAQWSMDHKRGVRPFDLTDPGRITERAVRNLTGYGPLAPLLG